MSGPAPTPTKLKLLRGNPGRRPLNKAEPAPAEGMPTRPEWLMPEAKREWKRIVPELQRLNLLTTVDRAALVAYCEWWARWVQAEKILNERGLTFSTENGYIQQRPEFAIAQKAASLCKGFLQEFGLTPASRSRISIPERKEADPFGDFLAQKSIAVEGAENE